MKLFKRKKNIIKSRKVTRSRFLYFYIIFGAIGMLCYFLLSLVVGWPKIFVLSPIFLAVAFLVFWFVYKNWKMVWFFISDADRGRLILFLNKSTHWEEKHKVAVAKWVYLGNRTVRDETFKNLSKKAMDGKELTKQEKKLYGRKVIMLPQQVRLGFNEALLVHSLIYAHRNICPLDGELREIMELTDEHMLSFDITKEYKKAGGNEYDRLVEIGKRKANELNK